MSLDGFLDKTVWRAGRGAKKAKDIKDQIAGAPSRAVQKAKDKVTPKCASQGGNLACKPPSGGKKRGRGVLCERCGNQIL